MHLMYDLNTIDDVIDFLGGDTVAAEMFDISQPAVGNWKVRGLIPRGWHLSIVVKIKAAGKTVNPEVFGMTSDEFEVLFPDNSKARTDNTVAA